MELVTIKEATIIVNDYLKEKFNIPKDISDSNISYLVQYGQVKKYADNRRTMIDLNELKQYYDEYYSNRKIEWESELGDDLNWHLSFEHLREKETTKHVHRLHPYKGKFIPQLVEYFIDDHTDEFKKDIYFQKGDIILDPFLGSGTTLVQAKELGMHGIGIDISEFNCLLSECKVQDYDIDILKKAVKRVLQKLKEARMNKTILALENELISKMYDYNQEHFPNPDFKYRVRQGEIDEDEYGNEKEKDFLPIYYKLIQKYNVEVRPAPGDRFMDKWFFKNIKDEIELVYDEILKETDANVKNLMMVVLSRTVRSCRATRHYDLATLKEPQLETYYCRKHKKICKPIMTIRSRFKQYANDTIKRIEEYGKIKTNADYAIISGDSRTIDIFDAVKSTNHALYELLTNNKIKGIITSPPYVGNIDYHEQHAYAYELFDLERKDSLEIGPLFRGSGKEAQQSYVEGVSDVLLNCKKFMASDYDIFVVANDKHNLYPGIAEKAGMIIINQFKRPVLNRTERDRSPYSEIIFHLKEA
jgi:DNA modification methylase